jgi:hypothetical protein
LSAAPNRAKEELTGVVDELRELAKVVDKEVHHPVEYEYTDPSREEQDPVLLSDRFRTDDVNALTTRTRMKLRSFVDHVYQCQTCESSTPSNARSVAYLSSTRSSYSIGQVKTYPSMNGPNPIPRSDTNVVLTPASFIAAICAGLGAPTPAGGPDILMIVLLREKAMKSSRYDWIGRRFLKDK